MEALAGCEFITVPEGFHKKLKDFLRVEFAAQELVKIQEDILKSDIPGVPYYFRAKNGDELYFILNGKKVVFLNIILEFRFNSSQQPTGIFISLLPREAPTFI